MTENSQHAEEPEASLEEKDVYQEEPEDNFEEKPLPADRMHETARKTERVILVGVSRPPKQQRYETDEHLEELELLSETAGAEIVEKVFQNRSRLVATTFIGKGKAEYIAERCKDENVDAVIFDDDLTPVQQRNLEKIFDRKVIDRTTLILDIFAMHARTNTAKTQVELAQLEYLLPRLTRMWTHLSKQLGGIGTKGPGETQIETDRRILRDRIAHLKKRLDKIDRQRATQRSSRLNVTRVSIVGYTNVGKSTLLNMLTGSEVLAENKLFATLDSTVRSIEIGNNTVLFTDTVGFIRKLPTKLVASFKTTLDEVGEADIILHVVDISHAQFREQTSVVNQTLKDIHAGDKTVITVFNKIDAIESPGSMAGLKEEYPNCVFISAARGMNLGELLEMIRITVEQHNTEKTFIIKPLDYRIPPEFHRHAVMIEERYEEDHIVIRCQIPPDVENRLLKTYEGILRIADEEEG